MDVAYVKKALESMPAPFYGANTYNEEEIAAAVRVIYNQSPFRYYGKKWTREAEQFEAEAAKYFGVKHACATNSGSGGLLLALHALDVGPGCEVIVPGYFWIAVSNAVLLRGAIPVIAEVDETLNMDPADLKKKITSKTKAIVVIHMSGGQADMTSLRKVAAAKKIPILEDFSQCNGAFIKGKPVGSLGDVGVTSLQLNKAITAGEGGLLVTSSQEYATKAAARADMGYPRSGGISDAKAKGSFITVGEGRRFNEVSAAIMRVQLKKLPAIAKSMSDSKKRILAALQMKACAPRKVIDPKGDLGSTLTFIFENEKAADAFCASGKKALGDESWFMGQVKYAGQHIYSNCSNMVQKVPVLPGGFPWNLPENKGDYRYEKGTCPQTDDLLARSVQMSIAPDLSKLQEEILTEGINLAFRGM